MGFADIEVPHPALPLPGDIRIDVEAAHACQLAAAPCAQQHLAHRVKTIAAFGPIALQPRQHRKTVAPAFLQQWLERRRRRLERLHQIGERDGHDLTPPPWSRPAGLAR